MTLETGTHLGPYEIVAPLGAGGMGEVYRAKDTRLDREVAVKVLPEHLAGDPDALARFEREAKAVAALSHPNILAVYDVGTQEGTSFVVTELLEGETLRERVRRSAIPWQRAVDYGMAIADGLADAHAKGITHRDLKPENIFLTTGGAVKILDFGLARMEKLPSSEGQADVPTITVDTKPGAVMGTPAYMSPEQVRGQPTDARSDIFAFGCMLYEMVTGNRAFARKTPADLTVAILKEEPSEITEIAKGVPPEFDRVIRHCLEKKPEERFQSARDLAFDLRSVLSDSGVSKTFQAAGGRQLRAYLWMATGALIVTIAALFVGLNPGGWRDRLFGGSQAGAITSLAVLPLQNLSGDPDQEYFADGMTEALISDLGKIRALRVISRTSVMRFKETKKPLPEIARELRVDGVVEGSVQRIGGNVLIRASLIEAPTDRQLWSETYEGDERDILSLQKQVARAIAHEIEVALTPQDRARLTKTQRVNPAAHEAYLRARYHLNKVTPQGMTKAVEYFNQAIAEDPAYSLAYAGLGESYFWLGYWSCMPALEAYPKAKAAVRKALEIDDSLPEAHATLGMVSVFDEWDFEFAEQTLKEAIVLNPAYAPSRYWYSALLSAVGRRDDAWDQLRKAREIDPLSLPLMTQEAWKHCLDRRYDKAVEVCQRALEMDSAFPTAHLITAFAKTEMGRYDEAITEIETLRKRSAVSTPLLFALGRAYALAGNRPAALDVLVELEDQWERESVGAGPIALVYMALGERTQAFEWLERSYDAHEGTILWLKTAPFFDPFRGDPRFDELLQRVGFEPNRAAGGMRPRRVGSPRGVVAGESPADSGRIMLAVLPFENLGPPEEEYFADGISDEIRSRLAAVRKLGVISRASAFQYRQTTKTNQQIGSELGVDYLIDGTIRWDRRSGGAGRVRITPELIRISDDITLWSEAYNRVIEDIFEVQSDIAEKVITQLKITLLEPERQAIEVNPTDNLDAYSAYLRGLDYAGRVDFLEEVCRVAIQMFERAVSLDPDFALAYVQLSKAHSGMHHYGYDRTKARAVRARAAVDRALELQPELPKRIWLLVITTTGATGSMTGHWKR